MILTRNLIVRRLAVAEAGFGGRILLLALSSWMACEPASFGAAEPLRGAAAILKSVAESPKASSTTTPASESAKLRMELTNFNARAAAIPPAAAAREWLGLYDRVVQQSQSFRPSRILDDSPPVQPAEALLALPPPAAWEDLNNSIAARPSPATIKDAREFGLRMLGLALAGDQAGLSRLAGQFEVILLKEPRGESAQLLSVFQSLSSALLTQSDDPKAILTGLDREIAATERGRDSGYGLLRLPDLVSLVGEGEATPYLRRALVSKAQRLSIEGKPTLALARKIALAVVNDLSVPRWSLVESLDTIELYEAMDKKFPVPDRPKPTNAVDALADLGQRGIGNDYERQSAKAYYIMALIVNGRLADAARLARSGTGGEAEVRLEYYAVTSLGRAGYMEALDNFLHELLSQSPELPYWEPYFVAAARTGRTKRMLELARVAAAKPGLVGETNGRIRENLYRALLAADQVDEGARELHALLASAPKASERGRRQSGGSMVFPIQWQSHALALARLGLVLGQTNWVGEGLAAAAPKAGPNAPVEEDYSSAYQAQARISLLILSGRLGEAEQAVADGMKKAVAEASKQQRYPGWMPSPGPIVQSLSTLAELYHRAGRHQDVLVLLEQSPHWGAKDLATLLASQGEGTDLDLEGLGSGRFGKGPKGNRLALAAARALIQAGKKAEARAIVDAMLDLAPGDDRAYELLIELAGQDAVPRLDELFSRDQFEERPLIWKALLLHQAGREEQAEKAARQAIAIDPSDGEQGKGDRMRVYAVLADIRAARGDLKEAEFFRGVVRAIRLSERADDFMAAGLLTRAVKMYQDSLKQFSDAYCIQSRLAVQLSELGQHELAAKHYEKAFELMPDSFGRVESHCFGCESTFAGSQAQGVAERVFTALVAKNPNKPQIHYLFGYLRQQQGMGREALPHFRRAVELDPDYLNAWKHIEELNQDYRLSSLDRMNVALNILRLDPLGRHVSANLGSVRDLRKLWVAVEAAMKFKINAPTALLALPASRAVVEKKEAEAGSRPDPYSGLGIRYHSAGLTPVSAGQALAQHPVIAAISGLMGGSGEFGF